MARFMFYSFNNFFSMKKIMYIIMTIVVMTSAYSCSSGHYVSAQPERVVVTRPIQPGSNYIWRDGDYYWNGGRYNYRQGYWSRPHGGRTWNGGTWMKGSRGYYWRRGGWR